LKQTTEKANNVKTPNLNKLPKHLQEALSHYYDKCHFFGLNPDWAIKAKEKADNDDFNPIHGMI